MTRKYEFSDEGRAARSAAAKAAWADPVKRSAWRGKIIERQATPEFKARVSLAIRAAWRRRKERLVPIPAWVPVELRATFIDIALNSDEFEAAAYARRQKAENGSCIEQ